MSTSDNVPVVDLSPRVEQLPPVKAVFKAASKSRSNTFHYTFLFEDDKIDCTCEGWRMVGKCWHVEQVREEYGIDEDTEFGVSL